MRAFSIFVSALALANLAQATPLEDIEFAQLDADVELEAGLPINKADAEKLAGWMEEVSGYALNGYSSVTKNVEDQYFKESSTNWGGEWKTYYHDVTTSDLDADSLKKIGVAIKKSKAMYNTPDGVPKNFTAWGEKTKTALVAFNAHIQGPINN